MCPASEGVLWSVVSPATTLISGSPEDSLLHNHMPFLLEQ
jgi:hypothetical protein